jgi:hypothetical protein
MNKEVDLFDVFFMGSSPAKLNIPNINGSKLSNMPKINLASRPCSHPKPNLKILDEPRFTEFIKGFCYLCSCAPFGTKIPRTVDNHCAGLVCKAVCPEHKQQIERRVGQCKGCLKKFIVVRFNEFCFDKKRSGAVQGIRRSENGPEWHVYDMSTCNHYSNVLNVLGEETYASKMDPYVRATHNETPPPVYNDDNKELLIKLPHMDNAPPAYEESELPTEAWYYARANCALCGIKNLPVKAKCTLGEYVNGEQEQIWSEWTLHD